MLFDICDYTLSGIIGPTAYPAWEVFDVGQNVTCGSGPSWDWADIATVARATGDALLVAVADWYNATMSVPCASTLCTPSPATEFAQFLADRITMRDKFVDLTDHLDDVASNPTTVVFNQAYYDDYLTAYDTLICSFKSLCKVVDNDDFLNYP